MEEELQHIVFNSVHSDHSLLFQCEFGLSAFVLQVIHTEMFDVIEILLDISITEVSQTVEVPR